MQDLVDDPIVLYILMRNDLASLNPGKACAHAAHAANQCVNDAYSLNSSEDLASWAAETNSGFGTTIVLADDIGTISKRVAWAKEYDLHAGIVHDPTYPLLDGDFTHHIPLDTCGYVFGRKSQCQHVLKELNLMP